VTGKIALAALLATAMLALTTAVKAEEEWRLMWTNPRVQQVPKSAAVELIRMVPGSTIPYPYTDEDGGYTFHIYFKAGPKIYWISSISPVNYTRIHAEFAWKVVAAWNASLRFAAENYEWGRHLSKLRLKFYTDANVSKAPRVDIVIDSTTPPGACGGAYAAACAVFENPIKIWGGLFELSHELGHALGLGHEYPQFRGGEGFDWRGYGVIGLYPAPRTPSPPDNLALYALSIRWQSLKNSTPNSAVEFDGRPGIVRYDEKLVGSLYSRPGLVWAYYYTVISEPGGMDRPLLINGWAERNGRRYLFMKPLPHVNSFWGKDNLWIVLDQFYNPVTFYGGAICMHPDDWLYQFEEKYTDFLYGDPAHSRELPLLRLFGNGTAMMLHGLDIQLALVNSTWRYKYTGNNHRDVWVPLKYFSKELLKELSNDYHIRNVYVIDSMGPATGKFSRIAYRDGRVCLEGLKERVLVEMKIGRAYKVYAGAAEAVPVTGKAYMDSNGTSWVLRGSTVYFRPLNQSYVVGGVKYVWKGNNVTVKVEGPIEGGELIDRLWSKQYLVEVDSPYPFEGTGWFEPGSKTSPKPVGGYVDLGNGTRLTLKGFEGYNGTEIVVDRPLKLKPVWMRSYAFDLVSRYVDGSGERYYKEGERVFVIYPRTQDFGNGTKVELANMTAYDLSGEVVKTWDGKSGDNQLGLLKLVVDRPMRVVVEWRVYHKLTVTSQVNSYETWVLNGTIHKLDLPEKKLVGGDTLMVLKQVKVNGEPYRGLEVTVTSPTSVEAVYQRKLMTTFMVDAGKGYLVEPSEVVLERDGEVEVYNPPFTYIGEGTWRVTKVTYLGGDITMGTTVEINIADMVIVPSRLRAVEITVVDFIGMPVPYASVKAENIAEVVGMWGTTILPAIPPWDFKVTASHPLGSGTTTIKPNETAVRVAAGVSPYTIALLATVAVLGAVVWRRRVLRR
jgi:hypothetical protein